MKLQQTRMGNRLATTWVNPGKSKGVLLACRDSYWTVRGLLYSGMLSTARGMILNCADLVRRFGFIPSTPLFCCQATQPPRGATPSLFVLLFADGTRSYYLNRSQPPVFSMMLTAYFAFTGDLEVITPPNHRVRGATSIWAHRPTR